MIETVGWHAIVADVAPASQQKKNCCILCLGSETTSLLHQLSSICSINLASSQEPKTNSFKDLKGELYPYTMGSLHRAIPVVRKIILVGFFLPCSRLESSLEQEKLDGRLKHIK